MTLKFDGWPRKVIGHLFHITSSFVHHLKSLGEFKPELLSGNAQFGSKSMIFCPVWPRNLMDDLEKQQSTSSMLHEALCIILKPSVNSNWSYSPETLNFGSKSAIFFVPCDLEILWMTLKNNRAPVLCCYDLYASFRSHRWIKTKVTVRKRSIRVRIGDFLSCVTLKFDGWPWKIIGHFFYATSSFVHYFVAPLGNSNWRYSPDTPNLGPNRRFF